MTRRRQTRKKTTGSHADSRNDKAVVLVQSDPVNVPKPPSGLLKATERAWSAFWTSEVARAVDQADRPRLERWIRYVDEWNRASKAFRNERVSVGSKGQPVLSPLASYLADLERQISQAETEFGMTPMARLKLGIAFGQAQMTAAELNRMIDENQKAAISSRSDDEDEDWTEGYVASD